MKIKATKKYNFFDKPYFLYLLKSFLKTKFLYILLLIYFCLIISTVLIIPLALNINQAEIITHTIILILYVMLSGFIGSFLAIHLFRSSIDNGTEILICSKPISRKEIVLVKSIVFILIIIFFSFLSSLFSCVIYFNKDDYELNNIFIVIGIFLGTFISSVFFGSIVSCFTLFFSKSKTMLISVFIVFIISMFSIVSMLFSPSAAKIKESRENIYQINTSRILDKKNTTSNNITLHSGTYHKLKDVDDWLDFEPDEEEEQINNLSIQEFIGDIYKEILPSQLINYVDIGRQLASIFTSVELSNYISTSENVMDMYSAPFVYKFDNKLSNILNESIINTRDLNLFHLDYNENTSEVQKKQIDDINKLFNVGKLVPNLKRHVSEFYISNNLSKNFIKHNYTFNYFDNLLIDEKLWEDYLNQKGKIFINYYSDLLSQPYDETKTKNKAFDIFFKTLIGFDIEYENNKTKFEYKPNNYFKKFTFKNIKKPTESELFYFLNELQKMSISALMYYSKYDLTEHYSSNKNDHLLKNKNNTISFVEIVDTQDWSKSTTFHDLFKSFDLPFHKFHKEYLSLNNYLKSLWPNYSLSSTVSNFFNYLKTSSISEHKEIYDKFVMTEQKRRDSTIKRLYLELFNIKLADIKKASEHSLDDFAYNRYISNTYFKFNDKHENELEIEIDNELLKWNYGYESNFSFRPVNYFDKYTKMYIGYIYNKWILIPIWFLISISLFGVFIYLYERKDFK